MPAAGCCQSLLLYSVWLMVRKQENDEFVKMTKQASTSSQPVRLYVKGSILGFKRGRRNSYSHTSLLKIEGVNDQDSGKFYLGKRVAYIYKAQVPKAGSKFRAVWGKITRLHGTNGVVRAKFARNLTPTSFGNSVRVMLYPSNV